MEKICFKCQVTKPLSDYYKHSKMGDGHLNKCKSCTKNDAKKREAELRKDPDFVESEKARGRKKYHRLYSTYDGNNKKPTPQTKREAIMKYRLKYPEKHRAKILSQRIKPVVKGNQMHHWSYREEHAKDVIELDIKTHALAHRYMVYDQEQMMYRVSANDIYPFSIGQLLDDRVSHEVFIEHCILLKSDVSPF